MYTLKRLCKELDCDVYDISKYQDTTYINLHEFWGLLRRKFSISKLFNSAVQMLKSCIKLYPYAKNVGGCPIIYGDNAYQGFVIGGYRMHEQEIRSLIGFKASPYQPIRIRVTHAWAIVKFIKNKLASR